MYCRLRATVNLNVCDIDYVSTYRKLTSQRFKTAIKQNSQLHISHREKTVLGGKVGVER